MKTTAEGPSAQRRRGAKSSASSTPSWHQLRAERHHRAARTPQPHVVRIIELLGCVGLALVVALGLSTLGHGALGSAGGWPLSISRLSACIGSYLLVVMVVLTARVPWLERTVGQDTLVRWHRKVAPYAISLVSLHVVSAILGYSQLLSTNVVHMLWSFWMNYPDVLSASVGFALLLMAAFTSIRIARSQMRYETWWVVHLYTYLGLGLAFMHQIRNGIVFIGHPLRSEVWVTSWIAVAVVIVLLRVGVPVVRNMQYQLRVASVTHEVPNVFSVTVTGKNIATMAVSGGQFFQWRFLTRDLWWHSHPYSLSALPRPPFLRVTVKALGDQSSAIAHLKVGTRVFVEGPYGVFTAHASKRDHVTLIAAGVGITPIRALLEDLAHSSRVTVIVRASRAEDIVHAEEIKTLVAARDGEYHEIVGRRDDVSFDADTLSRLITDITTNDIFVCGPSGFTDATVKYLHQLGVPHDQVHFEFFTF